MDENDPKTDRLPPDEESVRRLLEMAGPRPAIPQEDLDAIAAAARFAWRSQVGRQARERRGWVLAAGLAAALALAVGLAWWWRSREVRVPPTVAWVEVVEGSVQLAEDTPAARTLAKGSAIPLGSTLYSGDGRGSLRLVGGATVRLDVETRLRFASIAVLELERGAIYLDTGTGPRSPIEVRTLAGTVRDIGTRFLVRVGLDRASLLVRVRDGAVLTEHRGRTYPTAAGEELTLHRDGTAEHRASAPYGPAWEWTLEASPSFEIEGRSLQEFLAWISRETGWQVRFTEPELAKSARTIVLHGSLGGLRPDRAPFAILPSAGLAGKLEDGALVVRRLNQRF